MSKCASALCVAVLAACIAPPVAQAGAIKTLHLFTDPMMGESPNSQLVLVGNHTLFGTTANGGGLGGGTGLGTVFKTDTRSGVTTVLHSFGASRDGAYPNGVVVGPGGDLYGTTFTGFGAAYGTIFKVNPRTGKELVLFRFKARHGGPDGVLPTSNLIYDDKAGVFYGATEYGGLGNGVIFKFDPVLRVLTVLYSFDSKIVQNGPYGQIAFDPVSGTIYGITQSGNDGSPPPPIVYKVDVATGTETTLWSSASLNVNPGGVTLGPDGQLYLANTNGGAFHFGEIDKIDPKSGHLTVLHTFNLNADDNGAYPNLLSFGPGGLLYDTVQQSGGVNGLSGYGSILSIDPASGALTSLATFSYPAHNGAYPDAGVTFNDKGWLFGTTYGGAQNQRRFNGSVFKFKP